MELPYDLVIPLLSIYPKEWKSESQRTICPFIFMTTLSTTAKKWKQPECPKMEEWVDQVWYIYLHWNVIQPSKRRKSCHIGWHWWPWRTSCQVKSVSHKRTNKAWFHLYEVSTIVKLSETESKTIVSRG